MKILLVSLLILLMSSAFAGKLIKNAKLIARANDYDGFNLPAQSMLSNITPVINNRGDISFMAYTFDGKLNKNLFIKKYNESEGRIVYTASNELYISKPALNNEGFIAFHQYNEGVNDGIFLYNSNDDSLNLTIDPKLGDEVQFRDIDLSEKGKIGFKATNDKGERSFYIYNGLESKQVIKEGNGLSYLFTPAFYGESLMAKVRLGKTRQWSESRPDEVRAWSLDGKTKILAKDIDSISTSQFRSFNNSIASSINNKLAFVAIGSKGKRALYLQENGSAKLVVQEGEQGVTSLEYFKPSVNSLGHIAFRAKDSSGHRSIFFYNGKNIRKLISEGNLLETDRETAKIYQHVKNPGLSGGISLNNNGQIVFHCLLMTKNDEEALGEAVYLLQVE